MVGTSKHIIRVTVVSIALIAFNVHANAQTYVSTTGQPQSYVLVPPPSWPQQNVIVSPSASAPLPSAPAMPSQEVYAAPQPSPAAYAASQPSSVYASYDGPASAPPPQTGDLPDHPYAPAPQVNNKVSADKGLGTISGLNLGLQGSYYQYQEPGFGPRLEGVKGGITAQGTYLLSQKYFFTGDFRYAFGPSNYKGSGTSANNMENLFDLRVLFGRDFKSDNFGVSPFIGVGYRHFESNDRGITTTGATGYMRDNALTYIPIGLTPRMRINSDMRVSSTLEGDVLIGGTQTSYLSDVDPNYPNLTNHQSSGYGLRGDVMFDTNKWAFGPFVDYWNIAQSDTQCGPIAGSASSICGYEPRNTTIEAGVQFRYHFF